MYVYGLLRFIVLRFFSRYNYIVYRGLGKAEFQSFLHHLRFCLIVAIYDFIIHDHMVIAGCLQSLYTHDRQFRFAIGHDCIPRPIHHFNAVNMVGQFAFHCGLRRFPYSLPRRLVLQLADLQHGIRRKRSCFGAEGDDDIINGDTLIERRQDDRLWRVVIHRLRIGQIAKRDVRML